MSAPRHVRDRLPDEWQKCVVCLGRGMMDGFFGQLPHACTNCKGTGEVLREPERADRRRR